MYSILDAQFFLLSKKNIFWDGCILKHNRHDGYVARYDKATPLDFNNGVRNLCKMNFLEAPNQEVYLIINDYQFEIHKLTLVNNHYRDEILYDFSDDWCNHLLNERGYEYAKSLNKKLESKKYDCEETHKIKVTNLRQKINMLEEELANVENETQNKLNVLQKLQEKTNKILSNSQPTNPESKF